MAWSVRFANAYSVPAPAPLAENVPFAFRGERVEPARCLRPADATRMRAARNPTGKSNADVLREFIGVTRDGTEHRTWAVDFPDTMSAAEVALYVAPAEIAARHRLSPANPQRDAALRAAVAKVERFLAAPADGSTGFAWIEGDVVPDESLVVWARDDDFGAGVLASSAFELWIERSDGDLLGALRSFPFPWSPNTPLSSLTREQEDIYFALARAARAEDAEAIDATVCRAYGWAEIAGRATLDAHDAEEIIARLDALHAVRR